MTSQHRYHQFHRVLYPRYSNTVDYVQPLATRCRELIRNFSDKIECLEFLEFGDVYVETTPEEEFSYDSLTVKRPTKDSFGSPSSRPNRVVTRDNSESEEKKTCTATSQNGLADRNTRKRATTFSPRVLVTGTTDKSLTSTDGYDIVVYVCDSKEKSRQHKRKLYGEDVLEDNSDPEEVAKTISLLLERYVLKYFRRWIDLVQCLELDGEGNNRSKELNKENNLPEQYDDARACLLRLEESLNRQEERECARPKRKRKTTKQKENLEVTGESRTAETVQPPEKLSSRHFQQEVTELLAECQAVYLRSNVSSEDRPTRKLKLVTVEEISTDLFCDLPAITACGYRFDIFTVFVDEEKESPRLIESIEETLRTKGIFKFAIRKGPRQITEYSNHSVGSEIVVLESENNITGTVGGFAQSEKELIALTANHVTEHLETVRVRCDLSGDIVDFGTVLNPDTNSPTHPQPVDISAIRVNRKNVSCNTNFKDSSIPGCDVKSELFKMDEIEMLYGRYVHMWGAGSKPGYGKITMPDLHFRNSPSNPAPNHASKHIVVEDKDANRRFATKGDSGAIMCAVTLDGDAVDVISIFNGAKPDSGCSPYQDSGCRTDQDSGCASRDDTKMRYHSFFLEAGFSYLQTKHGRSFELCPFNNSNI